jgi:two-component system, OmpR family, sensor histidine kinase VicK
MHSPPGGAPAADPAAARLAAIVESSEDAIISKDLNGIVQTWNPAAERMFGYTADEIIGRPITTIIPKNRLNEEKDVLSRIRAGTAIEHFETVRQRKDGSLIDISLSVSPIKGSDGTIIGASKIARDISGHKSLKREAFRLAAIVDSSDDAIVSKDLNGIVQSWNRAAERMFGYSAQEMIGRPILDIIPAERRSEEDTVLTNIRAGKSIGHFETVRRRKDGTMVEVSLSVSPIRTSTGTIIGASKIARDITLQRGLMRALEEASRVKDDFLALLSHELRTPLNAVLGYTRMLRDKSLTDDRQVRALDVIERNAQMLSQLVSDVLDVSSIVTGKTRLNPVRRDLRAIVQEAADVVRPTAETKGVTLELDAEGEVLCDCDSDRIQQVLWNLLSNAIKFTPAGGRVSVALAHVPGAVTITVTDTGVGIPKAWLPHVFHRFWQGETSHDRPTGGLGIGLALARHFVELHGGTITASSEGEGHGSTFTVSLPTAR